MTQLGKVPLPGLAVSGHKGIFLFGMLYPRETFPLPLPIPLCNDRQLYVSTIDGRLTALDEGGHTLWTYSASNPLFFSSINHMEVCWSLRKKRYSILLLPRMVRYISSRA
jgi:outer membrane protein assembly factor BamB